jgi:ABC-2 type transport system ATP-binding protein
VGEPTILLEQVSKWYGQVLGVSEVSLAVRPGVVGLLGPNGAGKSTLLKILAGLLRPSRGRAEVLGAAVADSLEARRRIGHCPEHDGLYEELSAREFVAAMGELSGIGRAEAAERAARTLTELGLEAAMDRRLRGYSKGMRQRAKLAQALVHDPEVLLLDEPLTGCDPIARASIVARIRSLGAAGKTVVISSHVLHEIEAVTQEIVVIHRGQVLAEGNLYRIRELIDRHPHRVRVECDRPRDLAARLVSLEHVVRVQFDGDAVEVETRAPDQLYDAVPATALDLGVKVRALTSPDNNLQAVFEYLTAHKGARP